MTIDEIKAAIARADAASGGPWAERPCACVYGDLTHECIIAKGAGNDTIIDEPDMSEADTSFIAHARQDVPAMGVALLAAVAVLRPLMEFHGPHPGYDDLGYLLDDDARKALPAVLELLGRKP